MRLVILTGFFLFAVLGFITLPVAAAIDGMFVFQATSLCVTPGDTASYYIGYHPVPINEKGQWAFQIRWDRRYMDFVEYQGVCLSQASASGHFKCDDTGQSSGEGRLILKVKDTTPVGMEILANYKAVFEAEGGGVFNDKDSDFFVTCTKAPEFPSTVLPVTMIIGILGAVLYIQRTKEN